MLVFMYLLLIRGGHTPLDPLEKEASAALLADVALARLACTPLPLIIDERHRLATSAPVSLIDDVDVDDDDDDDEDDDGDDDGAVDDTNNDPIRLLNNKSRCIVVFLFLSSVTPPTTHQ